MAGDSPSEAWLNPNNFNEDGTQRETLAQILREIEAMRRAPQGQGTGDKG